MKEIQLPIINKTIWLKVSNYFSPNWKEIYRGPITQKLKYRGRVIEERQATQIIKIDRMNNVKYLIDEGDGYEYEFNPNKK